MDIKKVFGQSMLPADAINWEYVKFEPIIKMDKLPESKSKLHQTEKLPVTPFYKNISL